MKLIGTTYRLVASSTIFAAANMNCIMTKTCFFHMQKKVQIQLCGNRLCFCYIDQYFYFLHLKFQATSQLLWLHSAVCVGPGWKPQRQSHDVAHIAKHLSRDMRKPDFGICENKGTDQLRSNRKADQSLCFRYTDSTIPLLHKSKISSL